MRTLPTLLLISIALAASAQGFAMQVENGGTPIIMPEASVMQSDGVTLGQAIEQVKRQYNGRIVDAKTRCSGNRETHEIRVVTADGTVKTVRVPGKRCG